MSARATWSPWVSVGSERVFATNTEAAYFRRRLSTIFEKAGESAAGIGAGEGTVWLVGCMWLQG